MSACYMRTTNVMPLVQVVILVLVNMRAMTVTAATQGSQVTCCGGKGDVIFLLDGSSSMGDTNFNKTLKFMQNVVGALDIASDKTQIGVIEFSTEVAVAFSLNTYSTRQAVLDAMANYVPYSGGSTNTHLGLRSMREEIFNPGVREVQGAAPVAVLITAGGSDSPTTTMAQATEAKNEDIILMTVCIGVTCSDESMEIASSPNYVKTIAQIGLLPVIEGPIITDICEAINGSVIGSVENTKHLKEAVVCPSCQPGFTLLLDQCYHVGPQAVAFQGAVRYCNSKGAHLPEIVDNMHNFLIYALVSETVAGKSWYWTGGMALQWGTWWHQHSGNLLNHTDWCQGKPEGNSTCPEELCIGSQVSSRGCWDDLSCNKEAHYSHPVCQTEAK